MIVYHGTGKYSLNGLLKDGPKLWPRLYLGGRKAFSTTLDFGIATLFAIRRSPPLALTDEREVGVVIEYEVTSKEGRGWKHVKEPGILQDEKEVAIFSRGIVTAIAVWKMKEGDWRRQAV